ncbi:MAG TPA: Rid family hydrolase [Phycisphaerae bacterium]|nr:Rid family hydrolase [Phycisphaerae bacterium]
MASRAAYKHIAASLEETGTQIVHERLFGSLTVHQVVLAARRQALQARHIDPDGPVTYIEGHPPWGEGFAGLLIRAVGPVEASDRIWTIFEGDTPRGRGWRRAGGSFCVLQNIQGVSGQPDADNTAPRQADRMIRQANLLLHSQAAGYQSVFRTWFYLNRVLDWYPQFNQVRNARYTELGLSPVANDSRPLPASTGIAGRPAGGGAASLDLLAVSGTADNRITIRPLANPGQQEAFCYGSAFSRGMFIRESDVATIQISGTAAIDEAGHSLHPGDARAQIQCTLAKIESLIAQTGATLKDICSATVFLKRPEYVTLFREAAADRGLPDFPGVCVLADICRDELLFEIDAEVALGSERISSAMLSL